MAAWRSLALAWTLLPIPGRPATAKDYFNDPDRVCTVLEPEGLKTGGWKSVAFGYQCSTEGQARKSAPPHIPASFIADGYISYTASGDDERRVRRIKLTLHLIPEERDAASKKAEFFRIASILFQRLGRRIPAGLRDSIDKEQQFREAAPTGNLTLDPGRAPHTQVVLTLRDPSVHVVPIPRSP
jgi:hypothetical protein